MEDRRQRPQFIKIHDDELTRLNLHCSPATTSAAEAVGGSVRSLLARTAGAAAVVGAAAAGRRTGNLGALLGSPCMLIRLEVLGGNVIHMYKKYLISFN